MNKNIYKAGNNGDKVRSDCYVEILRSENPLEISLESKVDKLYGNNIRKLVKDVAAQFEFTHGTIRVVDTGALDFIIVARLEAALRMATGKEISYLLPQRDDNREPGKKDRYRFTRLYLPGNTPKLMLNAGVHSPDGLILDLEDAVAPDKKYEARFLVRNALRNLKFYGAERMVRVNQIPQGLEDLEYIVPHGVNMVLVPKCESAEQIHSVNKVIDKLKNEHHIDNDIWLMPIIESALGVIKAYEIASSTDNVVAMAIGLEDYTADLGTLRTDEGVESFYARSQMVNACRAAKIQPIDSVFSDIEDMEALRENVLRSKQLGFEGMGCIHPRQVPVVQKTFAPSEKELDKAKKIYKAFEDAKAKGLGVVSLGSKMIDPPVVKRAQRQIYVAVKTGLLDENWINKE
ncbi:MAG: citrate lyase subunit beta [Bacteroidales bacterium]|nr:citrate lyase subunit beta [Bacteroidales bacterium]